MGAPSLPGGDRGRGALLARNSPSRLTVNILLEKEEKNKMKMMEKEVREEWEEGSQGVGLNWWAETLSSQRKHHPGHKD